MTGSDFKLTRHPPGIQEKGDAGNFNDWPGENAEDVSRHDLDYLLPLDLGLGVTMVFSMPSRGPFAFFTTFFAAFFTAFLVTFFVAFFAAAGFFFAAFFFAMIHDSCRTFDGRPIANGDRE